MILGVGACVHVSPLDFDIELKTTRSEHARCGGARRRLSYRCVCVLTAKRGVLSCAVYGVCVCHSSRRRECNWLATAKRRTDR
jgi:hypothetical protein